MKQPLKTSFITLAALFAVFFALSYAACNKDNTPPGTIIKCVSCVNGGQCINDTCRCPTGYEGIGCEVLSVQKFLEEWLVTQKFSDSSVAKTLEVEINRDGNSFTNVIITGLGNGYVSPVLATVTGDSIYIPTQTINDFTIVGVGYIHTNPATLETNSEITMRYRLSASSTGGTLEDYGYSSNFDNPSIWTID